MESNTSSYLSPSVEGLCVARERGDVSEVGQRTKHVPQDGNVREGDCHAATCQRVPHVEGVS
jgi:hypothetical protein